MNKFKAIGAGMAAAAVALFTGTAQANLKKPVTYQVTVKTSFGTKFSDCFSFDGASTLTVAGYGTLTYVPKLFGRSSTTFGSVAQLATAQSVGFALQFNGTALGGGTQGYAHLTGNDELGDSYIVNGSAVSSCSSSSKTAPGALYHH